jgi:hypothetical protein
MHFVTVHTIFIAVFHNQSQFLIIQTHIISIPEKRKRQTPINYIQIEGKEKKLLEIILFYRYFCARYL